jgi:hypothetical protein
MVERVDRIRVAQDNVIVQSAPASIIIYVKYSRAEVKR